MPGNSSTEQNRRIFTRILFDADTKLQQGDKTWSTQLIDLSLKGILIEEPDGWTDASENESFTAIVALDDNETKITMQMKMAHHDNQQIGFQCENIDLDSITHLRRLVELNVGDHELLDRELTALGEHT